MWYPAPPDFIEPLLTCGAFVPANPGNANTAEFCDPQVDAQAQLALADGNPATTAGRWAAIDRELGDQAPWVPLYNPRNLTVLSARTGNYQFHSYWNLLSTNSGSINRARTAGARARHRLGPPDRQSGSRSSP